MSVTYHGTEENARNAWMALCAKNGLPEAVNIGTYTTGLSEAELHALRKTARRALNTITDSLKPGDYTESITDALVFAGNTIQSVNESFERIQDAEKFFGNRRAGTNVMRNAADFSKHYNTGHSQDAGEYDVADYLRGIANMQTTPSVKNALSTGTDTAGGFTVPSVLMPGILGALVPASSLLTAGAGIIPMEQGAKNYTKAVVSAIPAAAWRNESAALAVSDPAFNAIVATPRSLSFTFKVSRELLADAVGFAETLNEVIAQAFAKELDRAGLRGTGTAPEPRGIKNTLLVSNISHGTNGAVITNWKPLLSGLKNSLEVDGPMPTAAIMSPASLIAFSGLTDINGQSIDRPALLEPLKLVTTSQIPNNLTVGSSTNCSEIYMGNFQNVNFVMRENVSIQMLNELYAATGEVGFACHVRADVVIQYPQTFSILTGLRSA